MVLNRHLAKSISDVGWREFRQWLEYFGLKYGKITVSVAPHNTSQNCSNCGETVKKSLSTRTHVCNHCGYVEDRDVNAAKNILKSGATPRHPTSARGQALRALGNTHQEKALSTLGHTGSAET